MEESKPIEYKVSLLGDSGVGKTCILRQYAYGVFTETVPTIGVDQYKKEIEDCTPKVSLTIRDTAGQEAYGPLTEQYTRNSHAFLIVYTIDEQSTFDSIDKWVDTIYQTCTTKDYLVYLVENKNDYRESNDRILIPEVDGENKAEELGYEFISVSAKTGNNINDLFNKVAADCVKRFYNDEIPPIPPGDIDLLNDKQNKCKC